MKNVGIYRHVWPTSFSNKNYSLGLLIGERLSTAKLPRKSPLNVLKALHEVGLPLPNLITALRKSGGYLRGFEDDFWVIESCMPRSCEKLKHGYVDAVLLPKSVFADVGRLAFTRFCTESESDLAEAMRGVMGRETRYDWSDILSALEATAFESGFPPALLAIFNFVRDVPNPLGVSRVRPEQFSKAAASPKKFPEFGALKKAIRDKKLGRTDPAVTVFHSLPVVDRTDDDAILCRIAHFLANEFMVRSNGFEADFANFMGGKTFVHGVAGTRSWLRYLSELPTALALVRDGKLDGKMTRLLRRAAVIVWSSKEATVSSCFPTVYRTPIVSLPRDLLLVDPWTLLQEFGVDDCPPTRHELIAQNAGSTIRSSICSATSAGTLMDDPLRQAAFRVLRSILVHAWQRHCSLVCLNLEHLILDCIFPSLHVPWCKTGCVEQGIEIWALMPTAELQGLKDFLNYCVLDLKLPLVTRISEIAGLGSFSERSADSAQKAFSAFLGKEFPSADGTHLARANGLSWAAVRGLVAFHPELMEHPILQDYVGHPWFQPCELEKFKRLLKSQETDSTEIYRRIACWTTGNQFMSSYCRSWHVLAELHVHLARQRRVC